jgi:hypothetical protein
MSEDRRGLTGDNLDLLALLSRNVVLNQLERITHDFVDDYQAKLNGRWAAEHEAKPGA